MQRDANRNLGIDPSEPSRPVDDAAESGSIAREMAAGYRRLVESYRHEWGLSVADAEGRALEPVDPGWREGLANRAPESLSWWELASLAEQDSELVQALWERTKCEAARELPSGHRAAGVLEFMGTPWDPRPVPSRPHRLQRRVEAAGRDRGRAHRRHGPGLHDVLGLASLATHEKCVGSGTRIGLHRAR